MKDETWRLIKAFLGGIIFAIISGLAALIGIKLGRRDPKPPGGVSSGSSETPQGIVTDTEVKIEQTRTEIASDTDRALAERFNQILSKQKGKKG
jgi:hypothetical protein